MEIVNCNMDELNYGEDIGELFDVIYCGNNLKAPIGTTCINTDADGHITAWIGLNPSVIKYDACLGMWCNTSEDSSDSTTTFIGKAKVDTFIPEETMEIFNG